MSPVTLTAWAIATRLGRTIVLTLVYSTIMGGRCQPAPHLAIEAHPAGLPSNRDRPVVAVLSVRATALLQALPLV